MASFVKLQQLEVYMISPWAAVAGSFFSMPEFIRHIYQCIHLSCFQEKSMIDLKL